MPSTSVVPLSVTTVPASLALQKLEAKSPQGVEFTSSHAQMWSGVLVRVVDMKCKPQQPAWHDITSPWANINVILEQVGGRCEPRTKIDQPCKSDCSGPCHISLIPANMQLWGYTDRMRIARRIQFNFDPSSLQDVVEEKLSLQRVETPRFKFTDERITAIGRLLATECASPASYSGLYGDSLTRALVIQLLRLTESPDQQVKLGKLAPWQLKRVTEFMRVHLSMRVHLKELAGLTGLSQSQFGRAFKASTGLAPHRWQLNERISKAQELLLDGELSLAQIALVTGFSEQSHFNRVFRNIIGASPGSWARSVRN
jgi:AraC-like DNA-binding protein